MLFRSCLLAIGVHTLPHIQMVLIIAGIGNAAQSAAVYPLLVQLVPNEEVGFYTGFQSTMLSLAQPLTIFLVGVLINRYHNAYELVFAICAGCLALALILLLPINIPRAKSEIIARQLTLKSMAA